MEAEEAAFCAASGEMAAVAELWMRIERVSLDGATAR